MQVKQDSLVNKFLGRYQKPEDVVSFEINALATVEIAHELNCILQDCAQRGIGQQEVQRALGPVIQFLEHPEDHVTKSRLEFLMGMLDHYKRATSLGIQNLSGN